MKYLNWIIALMVIAPGMSFAQIQIEASSETEKPKDGTSPTEGFFVNSGQTKLTQLDCYTFDNLTLSFDIDESWFDYDEIWITITIGHPSGSYSRQYTRGFKKETFAKRYGGKEYAYDFVLESSDIEAKSDYVGTDFDRRTLTRGELYSADYKKKDYLESVLTLTVTGSKIVGSHFETKYDSYGKAITKEINDWKLTDLKKFSIPATNRGLRKKYSGPATLPVETTPCYPK